LLIKIACESCKNLLRNKKDFRCESSELMSCVYASGDDLVGCRGVFYFY
jgi:hypothetical protein